ncbi:MAG TPA: winged helix-turn-helix domain-containing protein [Terracidiphilus sp.]|jgi:TolB-like protein/DNA-binding winged helix-turn-helix (wHTH) protein/Tfp pilus assembly protein PilF
MAGTGVVIPERSICFGDCELNASAFELRRGRRTVKLERIPLQVLLILIEERGRVVTRESIADQIWGKDVFVDVDNGINTAIRKIRQVLNDDPQKPRFVETIPGMGYRFIAPLENAAGRSAETGPKIEQTRSQEIAATTSTEAAALNEGADTRTRSFWRRFGVVAFALLCVAGVSGWLGWRHIAGQRHAIRSIAVIPLQNLSGDPSQDYFADGMTEELITELARIDSLRVISHTSVMGYKNTKEHLPEIARELGVDAILEGSVIRENDNVRVTVQLLDGPDDRHLWGEEYERPLNGVLNLQREVGKAIAEEVRAKLSAPQQARLRVAHVVNPAAYDDYLKGRFYFDNGYTKADSLKKAQQYFEHSIETDPNFAQAYAGLANTYVYSAFAGVLKRDEAYRSAKRALDKAVELDDSVGEAHDTLAVLKADFDWDWEGADREFNRAITLAPSYSCAHESRVAFLGFLGRRDEAIAELAKIDQLDYGLISAGTESSTYYLLRDYPNLIDASKRALMLAPNEWSLHYNLAVGYEGTGKVQEAIPEYQKAIEISANPKATVGLARVYSAIGRRVEAKKILNALERKLKGTVAGSPYTMATINAELGQKDEAFAYLNQALIERSFDLSSDLRAAPSLDNLRNDPRFQTIVSQMGLPHQK